MSEVNRWCHLRRGCLAFLPGSARWMAGKSSGSSRSRSSPSLLSTVMPWWHSPRRRGPQHQISPLRPVDIDGGAHLVPSRLVLRGASSSITDGSASDTLGVVSSRVASSQVMLSESITTTADGLALAGEGAGGGGCRRGLLEHGAACSGEEFVCFIWFLDSWGFLASWFSNFWRWVRPWTADCPRSTTQSRRRRSRLRTAAVRACPHRYLRCALTGHRERDSPP
jgi:hypothetical protein